MNPWSIITGILFSIIGYFVYKAGKTKVNYYLVIIGIIMMLYPYFVPTPLWQFLVGLGLCGGAYFYRNHN